MSEYHKVVRDLTLMLIYLTSWTEKELSYEVRRAWKGYDFSILNELSEEELLTGSRRVKSVYLTDEGERQARDLLEEYQIKLD